MSENKLSLLYLDNNNIFHYLFFVDYSNTLLGDVRSNTIC